MCSLATDDIDCGTDRKDNFSALCMDFDYILIEKYWLEFYQTFNPKDYSIFSLMEKFNMLTTKQIKVMITKYFSMSKGEGVSDSKYSAPCKWDDFCAVFNLNHSDLKPKKGPFGVIKIKCEACRKYYTVYVRQYNKYYDNLINNFLCNDCTISWEELSKE